MIKKMVYGYHYHSYRIKNNYKYITFVQKERKIVNFFRFFPAGGYLNILDCLKDKWN